MKVFLILTFLPFLIECTNSTGENSIYEKNLEACLGESTTPVLEELIGSFEDFLIINNYAKSKEDLTEGIKKYLYDISNSELGDELKYDLQKNTEIINKLAAIGFIDNLNTSNESNQMIPPREINAIKGKRVSFLDGQPIFNPYKRYLPCLKQSITDTTTLFYFYVNQKETFGSLAPNYIARYILNWSADKDYQSMILKEIIIFECYIGLLINNSL